jgi:excisionase family DNA binding protein
MPRPEPAPPPVDDDCSTLEVARQLGLAVRSVQLMVDRGELLAWKTPGGHRRIARASVERWLASHRSALGPAPPARGRRARGHAPRVLLIEDSRHYQNLVTLVLQRWFPQLELHVADDGMAGLAMAGQLQPQVLLVDILLPGLDGAALISSLRTHPAFGGAKVIVVTSLQGDALEPYALALGQLPVLHKPRLVAELPALLAAALGLPRPA